MLRAVFELVVVSGFSLILMIAAVYFFPLNIL